MDILGRTLDLSVGFVPVNMNSGTNTGKRVSLQATRNVSLLIYAAAGTVSNDPVIVFTQYSAKSGGTSSTAAPLLTYYYTKLGSTTLAGTEQWTKVAQSASNTVTLTTTSADDTIAIIPIQVDKTTVGTYPYLGFSIAATGATQTGGALWLLGDLDVQRKPANLAAALQ